ncbi:Cys-tRNA(Pro) deacylase [Campylobacter sp. 19-13652]|uniref:Cys-tRNA(Pro) deacylase n=1 Tax=Campylobacter sp. 19-13652 TaxID=2840180 RepID=UPI001C785D76|nr:Cys-tRNA(Pro) deacylase [Campylobacter sp. 19-13652]BCX78906.1 Cys-tRNA(Pro)/Cys-tRNA(Cys) deacylase [Campylobacter sp. 19-13652]
MSKRQNIQKTNAARELDRLKIVYEMHEYEVDESDLSAVHVASVVGKDIAMVYKTIVCQSDDKYVVACLRGDLELDLKALAVAAGLKRCSLLALKDLERVTGYIRGGCSPLAMKKHFSTFIDERALKMDKILISAGVRGKQIELCVKDLALATRASFAGIAR